jgi:ABC-type amino acid transport substrate-binding protein
MRFINVMVIVCTLLVTCCIGVWFFNRTIQKSSNFIVGLVLENPPYAITTKDGELTGFSVELSKQLAKKLNLSLTFKNLPREILTSEIFNGKIDFADGAQAITNTRLKKIAMIHVYGKPHASVTCIFWNNIPEPMETIHDLKKLTAKKSLGLHEGTVWQDIAEEYHIDNIATVEEERDIIMMLKFNKICAAIVGPKIAKFFQKKHPEIKIKKIKTDRPWGYGAGIGVKKTRTKLIQDLTRAVDELKKEGVIDELKEKWFGKALDEF